MKAGDIYPIEVKKGIASTKPTKNFDVLSKYKLNIKHCSSVERCLSSLSLEKLIDVSYLFDVSLDYLIKGNSASNDSIKQIWANLPQSITSVLTTKNEEEIQLLTEYLQLYSKLRKAATK